MSTRGLCGVRNNKKLLEARYHGSDSYYDYAGKEVIDLYFKGSGSEIMDLCGDNYEDSRDFLADGLFCEFAYVYNVDNDTLEIYRGFFKQPQSFDKREQIVNVLQKDGEGYFCHLIIIIDKNKHTKAQVQRAFDWYNHKGEMEEVENESYPEREIIKLELPENYHPIV